MNFIQKETKSGVPLYILPMPQANSVASGALVRVGSRDEKWPKEAGLAHAFEHMFGQGSKKFPSKKFLSEYVEEVGGRRNAFTGKELTFFHNQVPFSEFERSVNLLSEQIQYSLIPEEKISSEVNVVIEELKRADDMPERVLSDFTYEHVYNNHPLSHRVLGTKESLLKFKKGDFINFINHHYYFGNYTFIVAGCIDPEKAVKMFNAYFTLIATSGEDNKKVSKEELLTVPKSKIIRAAKFNQVHINLVAPVVGAAIEDKTSLSLLASMIGMGMSSPLYEEIRNKRGLCYVVRAQYYPGTDAGLFSIYMATSPEKHEEAIDATFSVIKNTIENKSRLEATKRMVLGRLALDFENPSEIIRRAAYDTIFLGKPQGYEETNCAIKNISILDISSVTKKYSVSERLIPVILFPESLQ